MHVSLTTLAAAQMVGVTPAWATGLHAFETYSDAADVANDFLTGSLYTPNLDITTLPVETASISVSGPFVARLPYYTASASTTQGSNHAYASANTFPLGTLSTISFSGWYDTVTINGGNGTGVMQFKVQLNE